MPEIRDADAVPALWQSGLTEVEENAYVLATERRTTPELEILRESLRSHLLDLSAAHVLGENPLIEIQLDAATQKNSFYQRVVSEELLKRRRGASVLHSPDGQGKQSAARKGADRFRVFDADDALKPQPPIDWIVDGIFSARSVSVMAGVGGSKKTYSALDCAVCVAKGKKWLDFATERTGVLILDEESGQHRLKRRLGEVMRGHGVGPGEISVKCVSLSGLELLQDDEQKALHDLILSTGAKFVVLDALIDLLVGGDENSSVDMQLVCRALRQIAEATGVAFLVIHHFNRAGNYRGSSALQGAVDLLLTVESAKDSPDIDFTSEKTRDVEPFRFGAIANFCSSDVPEQERTFTLSPGKPKDKTPRLSKSESYVIDYLGKRGDSTLDDIEANADSCSPAAARRAVYGLVGKRRLVRKNTGARGVTAIYGVREPTTPVIKVSGEPWVPPSSRETLA